MFRGVTKFFTKKFWQENWRIENRNRTSLIIISCIFGSIIFLNILKIIFIKVFFAFYTPAPIYVSTSVVKKITWNQQIESVGNLISSNGIEVNSEVSGNISAIHFAPGQYIEKGKPLIDIDDSVEQAQLDYNKASLKLQTINYQRQLDLYKKGAASPSVVDEAKASMDKAQAEVDKIQSQINFKHIKAPFSGFLGVLQVNVGQYITAGKTPIAVLQQLDALYLNFYLPEQMHQLVKVNQPILFSVESFPGVNFVGKVSSINSKIDPDTHNILIQATVNNCDINKVKNLDPKIKQISCELNISNFKNLTQMALLPGMFANITLINPNSNEAIVVPSTAISYGMYGDSVYVVKKNKKDQLYVKRVFVSLGDQQGNLTQIKKGLKEGTTIVSSGELKLENNALVTIDNSVVLNQDINTHGVSE